ncbi:MAG: YigZ family protein [bacterium]|nr:YigZ family protein [bacterium]
MFPIETQEDFDQQLKTIQKQHHQANHHCFAYRRGIYVHQDLFGQRIVEAEKLYANDDGEPSGTASHPMKSVLA